MRAAKHAAIDQILIEFNCESLEIQDGAGGSIFGHCQRYRSGIVFVRSLHARINNVLKVSKVVMTA